MTEAIYVGTTPAGVIWNWYGRGELETMRERFEVVCRQQRAAKLVGRVIMHRCFNKHRRGVVVARSKDGHEVLVKMNISMYNGKYRETRYFVAATDDPRWLQYQGVVFNVEMLRSYKEGELPLKWQDRL